MLIALGLVVAVAAQVVVSHLVTAKNIASATHPAQSQPESDQLAML